MESQLPPNVWKVASGPTLFPSAGVSKIDYGLVPVLDTIPDIDGT